MVLSIFIAAVILLTPVIGAIGTYLWLMSGEFPRVFFVWSAPLWTFWLFGMLLCWTVSTVHGALEAHDRYNDRKASQKEDK